MGVCRAWRQGAGRRPRALWPGGSAGLEGLWPRVGSGLGGGSLGALLLGQGQAWRAAGSGRRQQRSILTNRWSQSSVSHPSFWNRCLEDNFRLKIIMSNLVAPEDCAKWPFTEAGGSSGLLRPPVPPWAASLSSKPWSLALPPACLFHGKGEGRSPSPQRTRQSCELTLAPKGQGLSRPWEPVSASVPGWMRARAAVCTAAREPGRMAGG